MAKEIYQPSTAEVRLGPGMLEVPLKWGEMKKYLNGTHKRLRPQYQEDGDRYFVWAVDGNIVYTCYLVKVPDDYAETFDTQQKKDDHDADRQEFENDWKPDGNQSVESRDQDNRIVSVTEPRVGAEKIFYTPNFCDPTTWYPNSSRVTDEALSDSGDGLTWNSVNTDWIDMTHGKVREEDALSGEVGHGYSVVVKVDGVEMTQRNPFATSGGDYTVNYEAGSITFAQSQAGKTVEASYSHATDSEFYIVPNTGKIIQIEHAEAQFSEDVDFNGQIVEFEIWAYDPNDLPNKVPVDIDTYKSMSNFVDEALGAYPKIPATGGAWPQGLTQNTVGFPFRYATVRRLLDSQGIELRVRLRAPNGATDQPFLGERGTATFYCTTLDE